MFTVLLVDDESSVTKGLRLLIDWKKYGYEVCGEASNGQTAFDMAKKYHPHVIITDIKMPILDGLQLIEKCIKELQTPPKFIILSGYRDFKYAKTALKFGANNYLLKPVDEDELLTEITLIKNDLDHTSLPNTTASVNQPDIITEIEGYIHQHFQSNISLKKISQSLYMSPVYLGQIFKKHFGTSFNDYLQTVRIDEAKTLLKTTHLKIYEIANQVGYKDSEYFSKKFEEKEKISPTEFRKNLTFVFDNSKMVQ